MSEKVATVKHLQSLAARTKVCIADVAQTASEAILQVAGYIPEPKSNISIAANGWLTDSNNTVYPKYQDITISGVTTDDRVDIVFDESLADTLMTCGVSPVTTVTAANTVRVRAVTAPSVALTGTAWIIYGKGN